MESFQLFDENLVEIPLNKGLPKGYRQKYSIPGSIKYHAYHGNLPMLFQAIDIGPYEAVLSDYLTSMNVKLICFANVHCTEIHCLLTGIVHYQLAGFNWVGLEAAHYNMIAFSKVKNKVLFKEPPLCTFDLHISKEKLIELAKRYPKLKPLIKALDEKRYESLFDKPQRLTIDMLQLIFKIREALFAGQANAATTIPMVEELVILLLENNSAKTKYRYSYEDITKIQ